MMIENVLGILYRFALYGENINKEENKYEKNC
jgi:hypothetical protein